MDTPVSPDLAHKVNRDNLWLSAVHERGEDALVFAFELPDRAATAPTFSDYVEVQRQAGLAFSHLQLGVPTDSVSLLSSVATELGGAGHPRALPRSGRVSVRADEVTRQAGRVTGVVLAIEFAADGLLVGEGVISGKFLPRKLYERLRSPRTGETGTTTGETGTTTRETPDPGEINDPGVALGSRIVEVLAVDPANPILSDHDSDHISGMAVVCAIDKLVGERFPAHALRSLRTEFLAYIEKDPAARLIVEIDGDSFAARVVQSGSACALVSGSIGETTQGAAA